MAKRHNQKGRSTGEARHVRLYGWFLKSKAWQHIDCKSRCAYIELARRYDGSNNGRISCSVEEIAKSIQSSKATAMRALQALETHGFIVCTKKGAFSLKLKHASEWRLTEHSDNKTHEIATKDFMHWPENQKPVSAEHPSGCRGETELVS